MHIKVKDTELRVLMKSQVLGQVTFETISRGTSMDKIGCEEVGRCTGVAERADEVGWQKINEVLTNRNKHVRVMQHVCLAERHYQF